jgi:A/G-specific adenine glycosylase
MPSRRAKPAPQDVVVDDVVDKRRALLKWYDANARDLPWRVAPQKAAKGRETPDPYRVWLSEIMLQQTTVAAVKPYFERFTALYPTVHDLAAAAQEDVLRHWAGLGYYARARNLHACAKAVASVGGSFPQEEEALRALPGIGAYTAAAIAAIAFNTPANVVDGNVERVMARLYRVETPLPTAKAELTRLAGALVRDDRPGDYAQALMDLGATICTPRAPQCLICPLRAHCAGAIHGDAARFPAKAVKPERPARHGVAFFLTRRGNVLLTRRPPEGLLGGMAALPSTPWREEPWGQEASAHAPSDTGWRALGAVSHVFTHFSLTLEVWAGNELKGVAHGDWTPMAALEDAGLPTVFAKAARLGVREMRKKTAKKAAPPA